MGGSDGGGWITLRFVPFQEHGVWDRYGQFNVKASTVVYRSIILLSLLPMISKSIYKGRRIARCILRHYSWAEAPPHPPRPMPSSIDDEPYFASSYFVSGRCNTFFIFVFFLFLLYISSYFHYTSLHYLSYFNIFLPMIFLISISTLLL